MKRLSIIASVALAIAAVAPASATTVPAAVTGVRVTVKCDGSPEKVTIHNGRSKSITIISVGSTYQPRAGEPYHVNKTLGAGKSITYSFGSGNGPNKLTGSYIFDSSASSEAAKVKTNLGTVKRFC